MTCLRLKYRSPPIMSSRAYRPAVRLLDCPPNGAGLMTRGGHVITSNESNPGPLSVWLAYPPRARLRIIISEMSRGDCTPRPRLLYTRRSHSPAVPPHTAHPTSLPPAAAVDFVIIPRTAASDGYSIPPAPSPVPFIIYNNKYGPRGPCNTISLYSNPSLSADVRFR